MFILSPSLLCDNTIFTYYMVVDLDFLYKNYKKEMAKMIKMTIFRLNNAVGGSFFLKNMLYCPKRRGEDLFSYIRKKKVHDKEVYYDEGRNFESGNPKPA